MFNLLTSAKFFNLSDKVKARYVLMLLNDLSKKGYASVLLPDSSPAFTGRVNYSLRVFYRIVCGLASDKVSFSNDSDNSLSIIDAIAFTEEVAFNL